jgi:hypothetical protein
MFAPIDSRAEWMVWIACKKLIFAVKNL